MKKMFFLWGFLLLFVLTGCSEDQVIITSIEVNDMTVSDVYMMDDFELENIQLIIYYSDGSNDLVMLSEDFLSSDDLEALSIVGVHDVTILYQGVSTTLTISLVSEMDATMEQIYLLGLEANLVTGTYEDWLDSIQGEDGRNVALRVAEGYIQWQYLGDTIWMNLYAIDDLIGAQGEPGLDGSDGVDGLNGTNGLNGTDGIDGENGLDGTNGENGLTPFIGLNGNWWIGVIDTGVFAGYTDLTIQQTGDFEFAVNTDGQSYYLVSYTGNDRYVDIPNVYNGYPVTAIGLEAFAGNTTLESVLIPTNIKAIESRAFYQNNKLVHVIFSEGSQLEEIGTQAFYQASNIEGFVIPASTRILGSEVFYGVNKEDSVSLEAGSQLENIESFAFLNCSGLSEIVIPNTVIYIGQSAFENTYNLQSVVFEDNSQVVSIGQRAFYYATSLTEIIIPNSVEQIISFAFAHTGLKTVIFQEESQLERIWDHVFYDDSAIYDIVIPDSVQYVDFGAFSGMEGLQSITLPFVGYSRNQTASYAQFGHMFGDDTGLGYLADIYYIPMTLTTVVVTDATKIGLNAFLEVNTVVTVTINDEVAVIEDNAFKDASSLTTVNLSNQTQLETIGSMAFYNTDLTDFVVPSSVTTISSQAFMYASNMNTLTFAENSHLITIGGAAFAITGLTSVIIPNSVISIGESAFGGNDLTYAYIPNSVITIERYAFDGTISGTIYCQAESRPSGWDSDWDMFVDAVVWNVASPDDIPI